MSFNPYSYFTAHSESFLRVESESEEATGGDIAAQVLRPKYRFRVLNLVLGVFRAVSVDLWLILHLFYM